MKTLIHKFFGVEQKDTLQNHVFDQFNPEKINLRIKHYADALGYHFGRNSLADMYIHDIINAKLPPLDYWGLKEKDVQCAIFPITPGISMRDLNYELYHHKRKIATIDELIALGLSNFDLRKYREIIVCGSFPVSTRHSPYVGFYALHIDHKNVGYICTSFHHHTELKCKFALTVPDI
jgi:hypothetical protein